MEIIAPDGIRIAFEVEGAGPPLVLLHGFFGDRTTWRSAGYVEALAQDFRTVRIDARGRGESDAPHHSASYLIERQLVKLPDCGHFETFLRADLALPAVQPFLESATAGGRL